ncbi:hypothetical protein FRC03_005099 [Tulasnella sp. 419]|nr:hypothetical protein FRC03_005099 [Tulasnella sp. 419]
MRSQILFSVAATFLAGFSAVVAAPTGQLSAYKRDVSIHDPDARSEVVSHSVIVRRTWDYFERLEELQKACEEAERVARRRYLQYQEESIGTNEYEEAWSALLEAYADKGRICADEDEFALNGALRREVEAD